MTKKKKNSPDREKIKRINRRFRRILLGLMLVFTLGFSLFIWSVSKNLPPMGEIENPHLDLSTQIFTSDGEFLGSFHAAENRIYVELDQISSHVKDALIATEDVRFESHSGIDKRMPMTLVKDVVIHQRLRGGSSLSQQLARNLFNQVGKDNSLIRKVKEAIVAVILESRFTKDEIMAAYLNTAGFYGNTYGIEMGARTLFSKNAIDLDLHEAALLVGLLKGPSYYSPTAKPEAALDRRNIVLMQMAKYGKITEAQKDSASKLDLGLVLSRHNTTRADGAYFKDNVKKFLKEWVKTQPKEYDLYTDGLRVFTTVDSRMQQYAELAVKEHLSSLQATFDSEMKKYGAPWVKDPKMLKTAINQTPRHYSMTQSKKSKKEIEAAFEEKRKMRIWDWNGWHDTLMSPKDSLIHYMKFLETGFMAMDPHTGSIKAWVGGINHSIFKYDHVRQGARQVGSTFKPFVYAAALEVGGFSPCDKVLDIPVSIELENGQIWTPKNSGGGSHGDGAMNYVEGLAQSKNQVTARLMKALGPEKVCNFAHRVGIESELNCVPSLCLGTTDLSVYEMVGAYSTFANYGNYSAPHFISRIEDKHGNVLAEFTSHSEQRIDTSTAYSIINMMMGVVDHPRGTGHRLRTTYKFTNQIAGKTGTTQNNSDGWFMGYTPNLVAGVWVGNARRAIRFKRTRYGQGANMALPIWAIFMKYVYADKKIDLPEDPFPRPKNYRVNLVCPTYKTSDDSNDPNAVPEFGF